MSDHVYLDPDSVQDGINWSWDSIVSLATAIVDATRKPEPDMWQSVVLMGESPQEGPHDAPPLDYEAAGPWEPYNGAVAAGDVEHGSCDNVYTWWRRPLRKAEVKA